LDPLIFNLLGNGFTKIWSRFKSDYIFGVKDIPLQKWFDPKAILVSPKKQTQLERIKLQLGIRYTEINGWLKITAVLDGGAAQSAGIAAGDLLANINGQRVTSARLDQLLGSLQEDTPITFSFYRDDLEHESMAVLHSSQAPQQFALTPA